MTDITEYTALALAFTAAIITTKTTPYKLLKNKIQ